MRISNFKLLTGGRDGIEVWAEEYIDAGDYKCVYTVHRTRKIPLSDSLIEDVQKLKYFFLNLTAHWIQPYSNHYSSIDKKLLEVPAEDPKKTHLIIKDIWNRVTITGAAYTDNGFVLTGTLEITENKKMGFATPHITEEDDIGFFTDCMETLHEAARAVSKYFRTYSLPLETARKVLPEEAKTMSPDELVNKAMEKFADEGAVILVRDQENIGESEEEPGTVLHENTGSIDGKNLPEAKGEKSQPGKDDGPFGKPASDKGFGADVSGEAARDRQDGDSGPPGDMSNLEHSENMGIVEEQNNNNQQPQEEEDW